MESARRRRNAFMMGQIACRAVLILSRQAIFSRGLVVLLSGDEG